MANQTLCGTWNFTTKTVDFTDTACDPDKALCGYYVLTGVHAGQIAVYHDGANCAATYYGDICLTTGKFHVTLPDNCCITCENTCSYCDECDPAPDSLDVTFTGIQSVGCYSCLSGNSQKHTLTLSQVNKTHVIPVNSSDSCRYANSNIAVLRVDFYGNETCSGSPSLTTYPSDVISVYVLAWSGGFNVGFYTGYGTRAFLAEGLTSDANTCFNVTDVANEHTGGVCQGSSYESSGKNGTVTVRPHI